MIIVSAIIGGGVSSVTKVGLAHIPAFTFSFIRFFIASCVLLPFLRKEKMPGGKNFLTLITISLLPVLNVALFVIGVKRTTASIAAILYAATPILTGLFSAYFISHRMNARKWFYILLGLMGVFLVILLPVFERGMPFSGDLKGNIFILAGVFFWSLYLTLSKKLQTKHSPLMITFVFIFEASIIFFFLSLTEINSAYLWWQNLQMSSIAAIIYVSILATSLAYLINQYNVKLVGPVATSLSHYLMPIAGYIFAFLLLGERLTPGLLVGTIFVFVSIWLTLYKS